MSGGEKSCIDTDNILVVDLDGTLLRSDMLYESFYSSLGKDWRNALFSLMALPKGRAYLKEFLAKNANVDIATLPYDREIISFIENWRAGGGKTALVTASNQIFAEAIADHLGIFDEVYSSDGSTNLKGKAKGQFLEKHYGNNGFIYMGDCDADLDIWKHATKAITVNTPNSLNKKVAKVCNNTEHLVTKTKSIQPYIKALRPYQWVKNSLVFLPMLAAHQLNFATLMATILAFISFSLVASSVYVLNDLLDLAADRAHPRKKNRPFASGDVPISHGLVMALGLLLLGILFAVSINHNFVIVMVGYYLLTIAYSFVLKRRIIIDICVLAGLYTMRIIAGGVATEIPLSIWLLSFSIFFFFSLAAVKRQSELVDASKHGKVKYVGRGYHTDDLPIVSMIATSSGIVSILVMALYIDSPKVTELYGNIEVLWGVCIILLYWISRAILISHRGLMHDDPIMFAIHDRTSQICFLLIVAFLFLGSFR